MIVRTLALLILILVPSQLRAETLGEYWGTAEEEAKYYKIVEIPAPKGLAIEAGSFEVLPDNRLAIGTRRGDIFLVDGAFDEFPQPKYHRYAAGLDELMGMSYKDGSFYVTQQTEVTRITDSNGDGRADRFETLSDAWGFRHYHEFAFGSKLDSEGNIWVALCLSKSYRGIEVCIISTAQQARPKVIQCKLPVQAQLMMSSVDVSRKPLSCNSAFRAWVATSLSTPAVFAPVITPIPGPLSSIHRQSRWSERPKTPSWTRTPHR